MCGWLGSVLESHRISVAQLVDTTGQGVFEFRVEVATVSDLESIPRKLSYALCGVDEDGRQLYVSPWLDLSVVLKEVEYMSKELRACGQVFVVASDVKARVVDQLL
jgi:hypothetical protein